MKRRSEREGAASLLPGRNVSSGQRAEGGTVHKVHTSLFFYKTGCVACATRQSRQEFAVLGLQLLPQNEQSLQLLQAIFPHFFSPIISWFTQWGVQLSLQDVVMYMQRKTTTSRGETISHIAPLTSVEHECSFFQHLALNVCSYLEGFGSKVGRRVVKFSLSCPTAASKAPMSHIWS